MGIGYRIFLVDNNDSLQRLSMARLDRLLRFELKETLPQYASKRARCAMVFLQVVERRPVAISHVDCFIIPFDAKGRINKKEWERGIRLAMELLPPALKEELPKHIVDARHRFAKKRYDHEFRWKPGRKIEEAMVDAIFQITWRLTVTKL